MRRATAMLAAGALPALLSACGTNNIPASFKTPAVTVPVQTATATEASTATATAIPATATPTAALPTATLSSVVSATPTATQTSLPTPTATAPPQAARVRFGADPMNAANPFPSDRLLDGPARTVST